MTWRSLEMADALTQVYRGSYFKRFSTKSAARKDKDAEFNKKTVAQMRDTLVAMYRENLPVDTPGEADKKVNAFRDRVNKWDLTQLREYHKNFSDAIGEERGSTELEKGDDFSDDFSCPVHFVKDGKTCVKCPDTHYVFQDEDGLQKCMENPECADDEEFVTKDDISMCVKDESGWGEY